VRAASGSTIAALAVSVLAVSLSGPLAAYAAAPALAICLYRNAFAVGVLAPVALVRRRGELADLFTSRTGRRTGGLCVLSGLALALHFGTWIPSTRMTSVATATALVATQPVWAGLIAVWQRRPVTRITWLGIVLAVLGAALTTGADLGGSPRAVTGDLLALAGGLTAAIYTSFGERARTVLSTTGYATVCYGICSVALLAACLVSGSALGGYPATAWLAIGAITIGPQLLGHTLINYALRRVTATTVAVLLLLEVPGAAVITWLLLGQLPGSRSLPGLILLVSGVAVVMVGAPRRAGPTGQALGDGIAISPTATGKT